MSHPTLIDHVPDITSAKRTSVLEERLEVVREALKRHSAAAVLVRSRHMFAWLTLGGDNRVVQATEIGASPVLVTRTEAIVITPNNEADRVRDDEIDGLPLEQQTVPWYEPGAVDALARSRAGGRLATEAELEPDLVAPRSVLGPAELARLRWLGSRVDGAMAAALAGVATGDREDSAVASLEAMLASEGVRSPVVLAASDERIVRYRHPLPTDRRVRRRLMLIVVGERWGLNVALTGMRDLEPPDAETARRQALAEGVFERMTAATVPGSTVGAVLDAARAAYAAAGFPDEWTLHHQGGSIGYRTREVIATPGESAQILPGMAFAWNPSITGAKAESTFYLDERGTPVLVAG